MSRKIVFLYEVGYAGMSGIDFVEYENDVTEEQLNQDAWEGAVQHAEMYGYYPEEWRDDTDYSNEENDDMYSSGIEGWWEDYDSEKHDGLVLGGGLPKW